MKVEEKVHDYFHVIPSLKRVHDNWSRQTDCEQADREQRRLAEKGDFKYIFTIPRAILPKASLCDEINVTKPLVRGQFVCGQFVAVSWLGSAWKDTCALCNILWIKEKC